MCVCCVIDQRKTKGLIEKHIYKKQKQDTREPG